MSEPIRYAFKMHEEDDAIYLGAKEQADGMWVKYEDYARLKAEVEELTGLLKASTYYNTSDEVTRLKAEVERLTKALEEEAACQVGHQENAILIGRLEAQVERLTEAGDRLCDKEFVETMGDYEFDNEAYAIRIRNWHKAKGVQS